MKAINLFTSMFALTTLVVASCSAPRLAQQNTNDDVYNSVAQAKEYRQQVPVKQAEPATTTQEEDYYGTSDPYYDMDYSSRINRFSYANPHWRGYYDPYFDGGWYGNYGMSLGLGFGLSPFWGSMWSSPYYGWGNYYSPFYGYNGLGYIGGGYYGGGFYGGGLYGGGYWGGGYYTGRTTNAPDYRARPARGSNNGYNGTRGNADYLSPRSSARNSGSTTSTGRPSRGSNGTATPQRTTENSRPTRTETSRPTRTTRPEPTYTPPPTRSSDGGSRGGSYSGGSSSGGSYGGSGGGGRPSRGGGR